MQQRHDHPPYQTCVFSTLRQIDVNKHIPLTINLLQVQLHPCFLRSAEEHVYNHCNLR